MAYYPVTVMMLRSRIAEKFPRTQAKHHDKKVGQIPPPAHLLWMAEEMGHWEFSLENDGRAIEWIGEILHHAEKIGLWDRAQSRELIRKDMNEKENHPLGYRKRNRI